MSRKKLTKEELKIKLSIRINPILFNCIDDIENNKSKYIEYLIYCDLKNKGLIKEMML